MTTLCVSAYGARGHLQFNTIRVTKERAEYKTQRSRDLVTDNSDRTESFT